jgi:hypothetical protein
MAIDTLKVARRLREAGFTEPQAEAVVEAVREGADGAGLVTKQDLALLGADLRAEIATVRGEVVAVQGEIVVVRGGIAALRAGLKADMRELEQRLIARIETTNAAMLSRIVGLIRGTVLVNVVTILGAMFAAVKLLGH